MHPNASPEVRRIEALRRERAGEYGPTGYDTLENSRSLVGTWSDGEYQLDLAPVYADGALHAGQAS